MSGPARRAAHTVAFALLLATTGCARSGPGATAPMPAGAADAPTRLPAAAVSAIPETTADAPPVARPPTGRTYRVRMVGDSQVYRFEPARLTVRPGDAVTFVVVGGGPHNVVFERDGSSGSLVSLFVNPRGDANAPPDSARLPPRVAAQLHANMSDPMSELSSRILMEPNDSVTVSFAGIPPGTYAYHCTPHLVFGMRGAIRVIAR